MKKVYIQPSTKYIALTAESLIAASNDGGVSNGSCVGNEYNEGDVSYSRRQGGNSIWDTWSN